jgi:hypothetical protein
MKQLYVIEARDKDGKLLLGEAADPVSFFGWGAITGINSNEMAKRLFERLGEGITLSGDSVCAWPKLIDPNWVARKKTW